MLLTITEGAAGKVKEFLSSVPEAEGKSLRVSLKPSGCAGYEYVFSFDRKKNGDNEIPGDGFSVLIDPDSARFLAGSTLDYTDGLTRSGFEILNPNVKKSCGCGQSHSF